MKNKTFIIAEAGVNHNGSEELAFKLIDSAVEAGVDAVKFQTFQTKNLVTKYTQKADYQKVTTGAHETQYEMLRRLELSYDSQVKCAQYCKERHIEFMSTPFDLESLHFLAKDLKVTRLKLASGELNNAPLLLEAAKTQLPIIMSSGMCTIGDLEEALGVLSLGFMSGAETPQKLSRSSFKEAYLKAQQTNFLQNKVTILHCTSEYPAAFEHVNLNVLTTLKNVFDLPVGLSDHTPGYAVPTAAIALGCSVIEKHFTLDKNMEGPDHRASLDPQELKMMVKSIREVELSLGHFKKIPSSVELKNQLRAQKSLVASCSIKAGDVFTENNLTVKRPAEGVSPFEFWDVLGTKATRSFENDELIVLK